MQSNLDLFAQCDASAQQAAQRRAPDHRAWLRSERLLAALDAYDDADASSGWCFAHQTGLCVLGLDGDADGAKLLAQWWQAEKAERTNLALRGITLNQQHVQQALAQTIAALKQPDPVGDALDAIEQSMKKATDLAALYGALDGHLDAQSQYGIAQAAGMLTWVGQLGREALRTGAPNTYDRVLNKRLSVLLAAQLGPQAVNMRLAEHAQAGRAVPTGRISAPVLRTLDRTFVDSVNNAHGNTFYKVRANSAVLLLQATLLLLQGRRQDETGGGRLLAEVGAGALVTASAGYELLASGTEQVLSQTSAGSVTHRGAQISLGRYRLWGATLSGVAGLISIGLDVGDAVSANDNGKPQLRNAYIARVIATLALSGTQGAAAFATAGPLFRWLATQADSARGSQLLLKMAGWSTTLAENRAAMLLLGRANLWLTLIVVSTTVAIEIFDDDALEKWCDRCCYRLSTGEKLYPSMEEELGDLFGAIEEVV